jgi:hypothetical protein
VLQGKSLNDSITDPTKTGLPKSIKRLVCSEKMWSTHNSKLHLQAGEVHIKSIDCFETGMDAEHAPLEVAREQTLGLPR